MPRAAATSLAAKYQMRKTFHALKTAAKGQDRQNGCYKAKTFKAISKLKLLKQQLKAKNSRTVAKI